MLLLKCREKYLYDIWTDKPVFWSLFAVVRSESRSQNRPTAFRRDPRLSALCPRLWSWSSMLARCGSTACLRELERRDPVFEWPRYASWTAGPAAARAAGPERPPPTLRPLQPPQRTRMMGMRRQQSPMMKFRVQNLRVLRYPLRHHASSRGPFSC